MAIPLRKFFLIKLTARPISSSLSHFKSPILETLSLSAYGRTEPITPNISPFPPIKGYLLVRNQSEDLDC